jgi:hypothetical protein
VLGESGGGCGGTCGGGSGGGGARAGGCFSGPTLSRPRHPPPPVVPQLPTNFGLIDSGAGCGSGAHFAACGTGNRDPTDARPAPRTQYHQKQTRFLASSPRLKCISDIDIIPVCLNRHNLPALPVGDYVIRETYETTYQ